MTDAVRTASTFEYGHKPTPRENLRRTLARAFVSFFGLNSNSRFATEVCQMLRPTSDVIFDGRKISFISGHGRLKWRAETFHTEEPLMIEWLNGFTREDVFLDVGANVGTYTIPAALKARQVYAIELDPANIYCLNTNVCLNGLQDKVLIIPIASSEKKSVQEIFYRDLSMGDALQSVGRDQILPTIRNNPYSIRQLTIPIDEIFAEYGLEQPTKIKIDVDGNERTVLDGAWNTIDKAQEVYFEDNGLESDLDLLDSFLSRGFRIARKLPSTVGTVKSDIARNLILVRQTA